jgi:hypothetical protein
MVDIKIEVQNGDNFIDILQEAFTCPNLESTKKTVKLSAFFALSGLARVKVRHKTLVKFRPAGRCR